jgi:xylulokinase
MADQYILSIDVGTSSTKTTLWKAQGRIVAESSIANPLNRPDALIAELDGKVWWQVVCRTIHEVLDKSGIQPEAIAGIGVDGIGWALVPVDEQANPLAPVMTWLDRRAIEETNWLKSLPQINDWVALDANPMDEAYTTPKLVWLRRHHPDIFEKTHKFLGSSGYMVAKLTGEFTCDFTLAYGFHFFDMKRNRWDEQAAELIGIPLEKMPPLYAPHTIVGKVTRQAAAETGLASGTPVIAGCLDAVAGALGAGVVQPGQTNDQGGQAGGFGISLERVIVEPRLVFSHHAIPGQYLLAAATVGGGSLNWFREQIDMLHGDALVSSSISPFDQYSKQAETSPVGANGLIFLPYMAGERTPLWSNVARGVFFGLSYHTSRADMLRAIMEGCAYAVYDNLDIAAEHGVMVTEFLGAGGATKSCIWCQIKADIYGKPFIVAQREDGGEGGNSLGLFALIAYGVGLQDNIPDCITSLLPKRKVYQPSPNNHAIYQEYFQLYRTLSHKLQDDFTNLDKIRRSIL